MRRDYDPFSEARAHFAGMPQALTLAGLVMVLVYLLL